MQPPFIDFHCHPALKPYGQSFSGKPSGQNSADRYSRASIWHRDRPRLLDKALQAWAGICKFTQADASSLLRGNSRIVCASLYPIERGFFKNKYGVNYANENVNAFVASVGRERVQAIQSIHNYFKDLNDEYTFYRQLNGQAIQLDDGPASYRLVHSWSEIERGLEETNGDRLIFFIFSIEGLHALMDDMDAAPDPENIIRNLRTIKAWEHAPFFVTFAHHFNNHLCGHAKSFFDMIEKISDQNDAMLTGFTDLGRTILHEVLSKENGRRMLVDIKHMSPLGRKEYFEILTTKYASEKIPVIASHAAANGLRSMDEPVCDSPAWSGKFLAEGINFYDNEILFIAKSEGLYGLQLDERRAISKEALKKVKQSMFLNEVRHHRSALLWNQVQYVAELLDRNNLPAWDCMGIGSDFDATIDPLNGFLTAAELPDLQSYLERHAYNFMVTEGKKLKPFNRITSNEIVNRIFSENGRKFLQKWF